MKKIGILALCAAMVMAFAALAVFAEEEPAVPGFVYAEDKTVFQYVNAQATAASVKIYAAAEDAEPAGTYPMTAGENGLWSVTVEGDMQNRYYTFAYTEGEGDFEIPDPTNTAEGQTRSYIPALVKYDLWVAGIQVSNLNAADILGNADAGAAVTYDAATNTLHFAMGSNITTEQLGISYTATQPLTIKLAGDVRITSTQGALRSSGPVTITSETASVFYAVTTGEAAGVHMGENCALTLDGMAILHTTGHQQAGLYLSMGATVQMGNANVLIARGAGLENDLKAEDEAFTLPIEWITNGNFVPLSSRPGVKVTIGSDPTPYTYAGWPGDQSGIAIDAQTADHSFWLTYGTWETGYGYVAYTKTEDTGKVVLCNTKITSIYGPALILTEQTDILLQGKNVLMGTNTGLSVTLGSISGYHGKLTANGIQIAECLVIKEGTLELDAEHALFGEILPDLSSYNGEYVLVTKTERPAPPEEETPSGSETETPPEEPQIDLLTEQTQPAPEEEEKPYLIYTLTPQRNHAMDPWVEGSEAHCLTDGAPGYQKCTVCQLYLDAEGIEIPASYLPIAYDSHDFTYTVLEEKDVHLSTCSRNPVHVYTLSCFGGAEICMDRRSCEGCGEKYGDRLFHMFSTDYTQSDEIGHWGLCLRPGCTKEDDSKAHTGGFISCNDPYICEVCGHEYGGVAGHSYTVNASDILVSEATCSQRAQYYACCDRCEAVSEDVLIPVGDKLPHNYQETWSTNSGGHWHVCQDCGSISTPERHVEMVVGQVQATLEAPGYTGDVYCQVCNVLVFRGTATPMLTVEEKKPDTMVFIAIGALTVSALGFGGVIVYGAVKKKKAAK